MQDSYLAVQTITSFAENSCTSHNFYYFHTLQAPLFPQLPAVCIEQSKLPSSTNIPCLFIGRPVIKIIPQYMDTKTPLTKAVIQPTLLSRLLFISSV